MIFVTVTGLHVMISVAILNVKWLETISFAIFSFQNRPFFVESYQYSLLIMFKKRVICSSQSFLAVNLSKTMIIRPALSIHHALELHTITL